MKPEHINVSWHKGDPEKGEFWDTCRAYIKHVQECRVSQFEQGRHSETKEFVEKDLRMRVARELFGEITQMAKEAYVELRKVRWVAFDQREDMKIVFEKLQAIMDYERSFARSVGPKPQRDSATG